jgi:hypothetical protein
VIEVKRMLAYRNPSGIVVVGGGQAGGEVAIQIRQQGFEGSITLFGEESYPPILGRRFLKPICPAR